MRIKYKMFIEKLWYERDIKRFNEIFKEYGLATLFWTNFQRSGDCEKKSVS